MKKHLYFLVLISLLACQKKPDSESVTFEENPPQDGFDIERSDPSAIMLADKVMTAMGGRSAWDNTKILSWNFFGRRTLTWNKQTGDVRIDFNDNSDVIIVNIHTMEGKALINGKELTPADSLADYLQKGKSIWINDSYWLVMPYKLKDTGVTLYYIGNDTTMDGKNAQMVQLAFENVGDTPDNVYNVWIDEETYLVSQWAFFKSQEDVEPMFEMPWQDYKKYGNIMLSGDRGEAQLTNIKVLDKVPAGTFSKLERIEI